MLICVLYSIHKVLNHEIKLSQVLDESFKYFLYTIGYGDTVDGEDEVSKNIFAMIGIISIALMTTFLTLNLFWRIDDILISDKIAIYKKRNKFYASILFFNKGNDISDLKVNFITYDKNGTLLYKDNLEYTYPLLVKNFYWKFNIPLTDIFWYKSIKYINENSIESYIYLTLSFIDVKNGQICIKLVKYGKDDFIGLKDVNEFSIDNKKNCNDNNILLELQKNLLNNIKQYNIFDLQLNLWQKFGKSTVVYNKEDNCADININFIEDDLDKDRVLISVYDKNEYEKYFNRDTIFRCTISGSEGINYFRIELETNTKTLSQIVKIKDKNKPTLYEYKFEQMKYFEWKEEEILDYIKKVSLVVYKKDVCENNALLKIYNLEIDYGNNIQDKNNQPV